MPIIVRREDRGGVANRKRVVRYDPAAGRGQVIYHSDGVIPFEVTLSPDGRYASFLELKQSEADSRLRLVIVDLTGDVVRVVEQEGNIGVREHAWCCGADKIAILTGAIAEAVTFTPTNVSVLDLRTGGKVPLEGIWQPQRMHWAPFDSALYIQGAPPPSARGMPNPASPVYRYHVPSARLSLTTRRSVHFSPDGRYYFSPLGGEFRLYRAVDDHEVTTKLQLSSELIGRGAEGWMAGADHVLLFVDQAQPTPGGRPEPARRIDRNTPRVYPDRWNLAVDTETGRVINRFQGDLGGWSTNAPAQPVERRTGVELVPPPRP